MHAPFNVNRSREKEVHVWLLAHVPSLGLIAKLLDMIRSLSLVPARPQQAGLRSEPQICWPFDSRSVAMTTMLLFFLFSMLKMAVDCTRANVQPQQPQTPSFWQLPEPTPTPTRSAISPLYLAINTYNNMAAQLTCTLGDRHLWSKMYFPSVFLLAVEEGVGRNDDRHLLHMDSARFLPQPEANANSGDEQQREWWERSVFQLWGTTSPPRQTFNTAPRAAVAADARAFVPLLQDETVTPALPLPHRATRFWATNRKTKVNNSL